MYTRNRFNNQRILKTPFTLIGGKTKIRDILYQFFPEHNSYFEPFGGSFTMLIGKEPTKLEVVNDISPLIGCLDAMKWFPNSFWEQLQLELQDLYRAGRDNADHGRICFNGWKQRVSDPEINDSIDRSVWFYLINKHCFNGILRFNKQKICNSGYGKTIKGRGILSREWLDKVHKRIQSTTLVSHDFQYFFDYYFVNHGVRHDIQDSFIFLDPPYRYTGKIEKDKGCVTVYNGEIFTDEQHLKLNKYLRGIKQAKWLMTINDDEWIRELYDGYEIVSNSVFYSCSGTKAGRGHRKELLIANYPITEKANQLKYLLEEPLDRTRTSKDNKGMDSN